MRDIETASFIADHVAERGGIAKASAELDSARRRAETTTGACAGVPAPPLRQRPPYPTRPHPTRKMRTIPIKVLVAKGASRSEMEARYPNIKIEEVDINEVTRPGPIPPLSSLVGITPEMLRRPGPPDLIWVQRPAPPDMKAEASAICNSPTSESSEEPIAASLSRALQRRSVLCADAHSACSDDAGDT